MLKNPTLKEEKKLWKKGYKLVAGLDEAGRGPLAGPVVAAAVMVKNPNFKILISNKISKPKFQISNIRDSKKLSPKKREEFYKILTKHPQIKWGIGKVSEKVIDKINILEATKLAMRKAIKNLKCKIKNKKLYFIILDGNFKINVKIPQKPIVKGDEKVFSCAAASIIAKVTRDRLMMRYHKKYPKYRFDRHKGYPTRAHQVMLKKHGPCEIHRMSFKPVFRISKIKDKKQKTKTQKHKNF